MNYMLRKSPILKEVLDLGKIKNKNFTQRVRVVEG